MLDAVPQQAATPFGEVIRGQLKLQFNKSPLCFTKSLHETHFRHVIFVLINTVSCMLYDLLNKNTRYFQRFIYGLLEGYSTYHQIDNVDCVKNS